MYKLDLHTHSILSYDGGILLEEYAKAISEKRIDYVAITDHNEIDFALEAFAKLGDHIIVGEEIMTTQGEIIGLFLQKKIQPDLTISQTIEEIKKQDGLVYIPHPFDIRRHAIGESNLTPVVSQTDILEVFNGRNITPSNNKQALTFARTMNVPGAVGSDSHSRGELGRTYLLVNDIPTVHNIKKLAEQGRRVEKLVNPLLFLSPSINKLRKIL